METRKAVDNAALRDAIYSGTVYCIPASAASLQLVADVKAAIDAEFAAELGGDPAQVTDEDRRKLQFKLPADEMYARIGKVRKRLAGEALFQKRLYELLEEQGFVRGEHAVDPTRLRAVTHLGHENPLAAPAYTAHRDSWYANPQAQINWWIPLHAVTAADSFAFFYGYFNKPVANESGDFDYDEWMKSVGWQSTSGKKAVVYPEAESGSYNADEAEPFACNAGDIILFSCAQLHQTTKNASGMTRFSVDFRTVHLGDHEAGKGAPNVDNQSTGCALKDYLIPEA